MSKILINDKNMENLGKFLATQSRFNQAVKNTLDALTKKYSLDDMDKYFLEQINNELTEQEKCQWDTMY